MTHDEIKKRWFETRQRNPNPLADIWEHNDYDLKLKFQLSERQRQENELLTKVAEAAAFIADWQPSTHEEYKELKSALSAWRKWKENK